MDVGQFATCYGAEVIEAIDNHYYSLSLLFDYAIPFTHTGAKLGYDFSGSVNAKVFVVNSRDNFADNIVKYKFCDTLSLAVRGKQFHDRDGVRTGTPQTIKEFTITAEIKVWKKLIIRPEYRHDESNKSVFDGRTIKTRNTPGISIMFRHEW